MTEKKPKDTFLAQALLVGLIASIISIGLGLFFHTFHFIPFHLLAWTKQYFVATNYLGTFIIYGLVLVMIGIVSMLLAFIYAVFLRKKKHWIYGAVYGVLLWGLFYLLLPFLMKDMITIFVYEIHVTITSLSFFLLYGVFVGYSISFHDQSIARLK